jgi:hypothetical protein
LACAGLLLAGAPAFAQSSSAGGAFGGSGSSGSSFGGSSSIGGGGGGGLSSGGGAFGGGGSSGLGGTSSFGNSAFGGTTTNGGGQSSSGSAPGRSGASAAIGATSFLGAYYGNPLAQGLTTGSTTGSATSQANFGTALYNLTTTNQTNTSSRTTAAASGYFGAPIGVRRLPAYSTTLKIKNMPPPESPLQVREDLRNMLARSGQLDSRDAVRVLMDGPAVVLQGVVADNDERRLVENMVRLTPGVNAIRNELAARNP